MIFPGISPTWGNPVKPVLFSRIGPLPTNIEEIALSPRDEDDDIAWRSQKISGSLSMQTPNHLPRYIRNFYRLDPAFYRGEQPGLMQNDRVDRDALSKGLVYLRDYCGVRTILNLRNDTDLKPEHSDQSSDHRRLEKDVIDELNRNASLTQQLEYINIPVQSGRAITDDQFGPIMDILKKASPEKPVFVHCKAGIDRTGLVACLYRALKDHQYPELRKAPFEDVYVEMRHCGHNPEGLWKGYSKNLKHHLQKPDFGNYYQRNHIAIDDTAKGYWQWNPITRQPYYTDPYFIQLRGYPSKL